MSEFTPTGRMIVYVEWDVRAGKHGASTGDVWARADLIGGGKAEFAGTDQQVTDWALNVMTAAGARGIACEIRDGRGLVTQD